MSWKIHRIVWLGQSQSSIVEDSLVTGGKPSIRYRGKVNKPYCLLLDIFLWLGQHIGYKSTV